MKSKNKIRAAFESNMLIKGFGPLDLPELDKLLSYYKNGAPCFDMTPNHMTEEVARRT